MSFVKLDNGNVEHVAVLLRPHAHFISSSAGGGVTGSQHVSPIRSPAIKQVIDLKTSAQNLVEDATDDVSGIRQINIDNFGRALAIEGAQAAAQAGAVDLSSFLSPYLSLID